VYSNSGSVNPSIIIENNNRQLPVMNSDAAETPGSLERGDRGATVTTDVAGTEQKTWTGHQYTQISRTHVEPVSEELEETSPEYSHFGYTVVLGATVGAHTCEGGWMPLEGWVTTACKAPYLGTSEEDPDEQDLFTKLLAEMELEIEEEAEIEFENRAGSVANASEIQEDSSCCFHLEAESRASVALSVEHDVRTDHPTSTVRVQRPHCSEEVQPTRFSSAKQEVPESVTELEPEELDEGHEAPDTNNADQEGPTQSAKEEILYSHVTTTGNENAPNVDNEDIQRALNLEEIFSFFKDDEETGSLTASSDNEDIPGTTMQDSRYETSLIRVDNDTFNTSNENSGNEFRDTTGDEIETQPQTGKRKEPCHNLGRGEHSPTHTNSWKKNKAYFHLGRFPYRDTKQEVVGETCLSTGNRPTSSSQSFAGWIMTPQSLSCQDLCAERRSTKGTRNASMKIGKTGSSIRKSKIPVPYNQRVIRQLIMANDCTKECRTFQYPAGSTSDYSFPAQNAKRPESYAPHIEQPLSTGSSTGAQHQKQLCQLLSDTSLSDRREDATDDSIVAGNDDNDRQQERHLQLAADDRRELPSDACQQLISRHAETNEYNRAALPPERPETDKKECRYCIDRPAAYNQSRVVVQSTWLETFQSEYNDAYGKRGIGRYGVDIQSHEMSQQECCLADYNLSNRPQEEHIIRGIQDVDLPPSVERPQHIARTEAETDVLGLNESVDLFLSDSQQIACTTGNGQRYLTAFCSDPSVRSTSKSTDGKTTSSMNSASSLFLLPFSMATGSSEEMRSSSETASPPCMTVTTSGSFETTATVSTCETCVEETKTSLQTGSDVATTGNN